jgi:hypothetical protein
MKKTLSLAIAFLICTAAMAQLKTDAYKAKTDTLEIPLTQKFVRIRGKLIDTRAFEQIPVFLPLDVLQFIVGALINGQQPQYNAQQMQQHVSITQQLQQLLPPQKPQ